MCEYIKDCPIIDEIMKSMPSSAALVRRRYCMGSDNINCARYILAKAMGRQAVPRDLFPNQLERVHSFLR